MRINTGRASKANGKTMKDLSRATNKQIVMKQSGSTLISKKSSLKVLSPANMMANVADLSVRQSAKTTRNRDQVFHSATGNASTFNKSLVSLN